ARLRHGRSRARLARSRGGAPRRRVPAPAVRRRGGTGDDSLPRGRRATPRVHRARRRRSPRAAAGLRRAGRARAHLQGGRDHARLAKAQDAVTASAGRSAAANDALSKSHRRLSDSIPLQAMNLQSRYSAEASKNLATLGNVAGKTAAVGIVAVGAAVVYAAAK